MVADSNATTPSVPDLDLFSTVSSSSHVDLLANVPSKLERDGSVYFRRLASRSNPSTPTNRENAGSSKGTTPSTVASRGSSARKLEARRRWSMKTYDDLTQLGRGTYGVVYKTASGERPIALKVSNVDEDGIPETTVREVVLLRELSGHPNILTFYDVNCPSAEKVCISTELLDMDLRACIKRHPHRLNQKVKTIAKAILAGIHHCHTNGVMHRDLKPHNILISQDLSRIKLGDFGLARYRHDPRKTLTHEVVTLWYRAPEVLLGDCCYDESIDLWSCGCVIAELLTGQPLFPGDSEIDMIFRIFLLLGTPTPKEWPKLSLEPYEVFPKFLGRGLHSMVAEPEAVSFLEQMLQVNPARRLTAAQCLRHPWLRC